MSATRQTSQHRRAWRYRRVTALLLSILLITSGALLFRKQLLVGLAWLWIVSPTPEKADAIAVLGGGIDNRPFIAARLFQQSLAPRVLLPRNPELPSEGPGLRIRDSDLTIRILEQNGVPSTAIQFIGTNLDSTHAELVAIGNWCRENNANRILIPTELFHTRRVASFGSRELNRLGIQLQVIPVANRKYNATNWWQHEEGVVAFNNEVIKFVYYLLRY